MHLVLGMSYFVCWWYFFLLLFLYLPNKQFLFYSPNDLLIISFLFLLGSHPFPGNYSRLVVYFRFERQIGHHLIQTFAPSSLVVMLSWFSFWLDLDAIPGRVTLLVTCMLTLVTMFTGLRADIPPVAYVKVRHLKNFAGSSSVRLAWVYKTAFDCVKDYMENCTTPLSVTNRTKIVNVNSW